jgi:hypothetical protein
LEVFGRLSGWIVSKAGRFSRELGRTPCGTVAEIPQSVERLATQYRNVRKDKATSF